MDLLLTIDNTNYFIDVSIFNIGCPSNASSRLDGSIKFMLKKEESKRNDYVHVFLNDNPNFIPFIIDISGNLGPAGIRFIKLLSERCSGITKNKFVKHFLICISIVLNCGFNDTQRSFFQVIEKNLVSLIE